MPSFFKTPKIEVFIRHCHYSDVSAHKRRYEGFSHEKCFKNLLSTVDPEKVNLTFLLDTHHDSGTPHFVEEQDKYPVVKINAGAEGASFLALLDHVKSCKLPSETIIYFLEDDYLHGEGWVEILQEAFTLPEVDYVTLFDHKDKYFFPMYKDLTAKLYHTKSCHWRTTPSTTNTYAMKMKTLKKHWPIHRKYSAGYKITADHDKFLELGRLGATLVSPLPGYSTHMEPEFASPCVDWGSLLSR